MRLELARLITALGYHRLVPELPDVVVYIEALQERIVGRPLRSIRLGSPFVLRSVDPPIAAAAGRTVGGLRRIGKRIVLELEGDFFLVLHLMIAGRLRFRTAGAPLPRRHGLAAFDFPDGTLLLTEAGSKKRALTDPRLFSGVGNAYSDEILHRAHLSPLRLTRQLNDEEVARLYEATRSVLGEWTQRLRIERGSGFPENVTAFREGMAVHGRFGRPCPVCGTEVQRIVYAENECNYCPRCQTGGLLLADRALSRLLKDDWPKRIEDLEEKNLRVDTPRPRA